MANTNLLRGMQCPECGYTDEFVISVDAVAYVTDQGIDSCRDHTWQPESGINCRNCGWDGQVKDTFITAPHSQGQG